MIIKVRELITLKTASYETIYEDREIDISVSDLIQIAGDINHMDWSFWTDNIDLDEYEDTDLWIYYDLSDPDDGEIFVSYAAKESDIIKELNDDRSWELLNISCRIRQYRDQTGITQTELAQLVGVSRPTVARWESGELLPTIESLVRAARFFKTSIDDLVTVEPVKDLRKLPEAY